MSTTTHKRCSEGEKIHKEWRDQVKAASVDTWRDIFFNGYKDYETHAMTCPICYEVEMERSRKYIKTEVRTEA